MKIDKVIKFADAIEMNKNYSSLFDSAEVVLLDTTHNFVMKGVEQIRFALDHFFVVDESRQFFVFDRNGRGRTIINKIGQGQNEYVSIRGFDIFPSDSTICLLTYPSKLMFFTLDGEYIRDKKIDYRGFEMALLDSTAFVVYTDNVGAAEPKDKKLVMVQDLVTTKNSRHITGYNFLGDRKIPSFQQRRTFIKLPNGEVLFFQPLSNNIYSITKNDVSIKYKIDFGEKNPPDDLTEQIPAATSSIDFVENHFPVHGFNSCWENGQYFYIQTKIDKQLTDLLFDKQEQKLYAGWINDDLTECQSKIVDITPTYLVSYVSAEDIIGLIDYLNYQNTVIPEKSILNKISEFANNVGNPVVFLYHFR